MALGAVAAVSSLVSVFPQIVWLSEHKEELFLFAGLAIAASGVLQWRNRNAPFPVAPALRSACLRTRKTSLLLYGFSVTVYLVGGLRSFNLGSQG